MLFLGCAVLLLSGCSDPGTEHTHQLVITNASVLNTLTGEVVKHQTIVIDSGYITDVLDSVTDVQAGTIIDAQNKLVVPGFIDAVGHLDDVFGDRPDTLKSSVEECMKVFSETYLPYGVTTVRSSGDGTGYYAIADYLRQFPSAQSPDFYFSGGSIAGWYDGSPYINHLLVQDSTEAEYWVTSMYKAGSVSSIKLYCNGAMNYSIFRAALDRAQNCNLNVTAQVQNEITIDSALSLGLRNFEHASTLVYQRNLFHFTDDRTFNDTLQHYYHDQEEGSRIYPYMEAALRVGPDHPQVIATIANMKAHNATMTTSLHFFAQWLNRCYFSSVPKAARFDTHHFTTEQLARCTQGFDILSRYVKQMYDAGVLLAIGTDHKDGGKAVLSEILLLHEAGIPMNDCLRIATINTAKTIGQEEKYGSITAGKHANLIIFEEDALNDPQALLKGKTVIKDGVVYSAQ
jgi:imidazolonepropionase-like amidohydrolase